MNQTYNFIKLLSKSKIYYISVFAFLFFGMTLILFEGYRGSFLTLNRINSKWIDLPMLILTFCSEPLTFIPVTIFFLRKKKFGSFILIIVSVIFSGLIVQFLKHYIFPEWHRPPFIFGLNYIHTVHGYILNHNSFPSGHSATIAGILTILAHEYSSKKLTVILIGLMTIILSYTRVYLGVHFFGDVILGNFIGMSTSMLLIWLLKDKLELFFLNRKDFIFKVFFVISIIALIFSLTDIITKIIK